MTTLKIIREAYDQLAKILGFKCFGCVKCEYFDSKSKNIIPLMKEEVEILRKNGKLYGIVLDNKIYGIKGYLKFKPNKNECIFLDKNNRCKIHAYKPIICYIHPFQVFTTGFVFGGGMVFDTKCSWVEKNRKKLDKPSKKVVDAYNYFYKVVMDYKILNLQKKEKN